MKKFLLFSFSMLLSLSAFAQGWVQPAPTASEFEFDKVFYLFNKDAAAFFTEGNDWGTRASYGDTGLQVKFTQYIVEGEEWDGKTILFNDSSLAKKAWKLTFIDSEQAAYVDLGNQANYFWEIQDMGNNTYRLYGGALNPTFNPTDYEGCYFGINPAEAKTVIFPLLDSYTEGAMIDWQLITPEEYETYLPKAATYKNAKALGDLIAQAKASEAASMLSEAIQSAETVYNNLNSTAEELAAATKNLKIAMNYASLAGASESNPKDATGFIENSNFDSGNINGWDLTFEKNKNVTNLGYQSASYQNGEVTISQFIEAWANSDFAGRGMRSLGDGTISQTLPMLPQGKWKFTCDAIAVTQDDVATPCTGVQLFAKGGNIEVSEEVHTGNNAPEHFEITFVSSGGDITMGIRTVNSTANWMAADNFTLTYYGEVAGDPEKVVLDTYISQLEKQYPNVEDIYCNAEVKTAYQDAIEAAKGATENYLQVKEDLAVVAAALATSINDYKAFRETIDDTYVKMEEFSGTKWQVIADEQLGDLVMEWEDAYLEGTADAEYITAAKVNVRKIIVDGVTELMEASDDVSILLNNGTFDKDFSGWEFTGSKPAWGGMDVQNINGTMSEIVMTSGNAEKWHAAFSMYQVVKNMPKGSFTLTLQAFERNDDGFESHWAEGPEVGITGYVFCNEKQTKLHNIMACASPDQLFASTDPASYPSDRTVTVEGETRYIPDSMCGANYYFWNPDNYKVKVNFVLEEAGDSITIGIKTDATNQWIIFDNFRLIYNGAGAEAYYEQMNELIEELQGVFGEAALYGADAQTKVDDAIAALQSALKSSDPDVCQAAIKQGEAAKEYAKASMTVYNKLLEMTATLDEAIQTYAETADQEAIDFASNTLDAINAAVDNCNKTNEEAEALLTDANKAITLLKLPAGWKSATEENPSDFTDLIINPTFDTIGDFTGWLGTGFGAGGTTSTNAEHYNRDFDSYQIIYSLPAGYYVAGVDGFYRRGSIDQDYAFETSENPDSCRNAKLYVETADGVEESPILALGAGATSELTSGVDYAGSGMKVPNSMADFTLWNEAGFYKGVSVLAHLSESGDLKIGVKKSGHYETEWSIFDNFTLRYLGTEAPVAIDTIEASETIIVKGIFNLAGQKLAAPQKGINIINGKKVLVK